MDFAPTPHWHPVDRDDFQTWLQEFPADEPMGMAGGYTLHPVTFYLNDRVGGSWCLEVTRDSVYLMNREDRERQRYAQASWLLDFCWELKRGDAYRDVAVAHCLLALERVP